jgi:hypothetical protein
MKTLSIIFKNVLFFGTLCALLLCFYDSLYSQVPFSRVKSDVLKEYKGVTVVDRGSGRIEIDKSYIPNRKYYVAFVRASNKDKIEGHNVIYHRDLVVNYDILGGKYVFNSITRSDWWLVGDLKPPTLNEFSELLKNDLKGFFDSYLFNEMTEYSGVKEILKDKFPCYECDNFEWSATDEGKSVNFKAVIAYSCINGMDLEKREDAFLVTLKRNGIDKPWKSGGVSRANTGNNTIEKKTLSTAESEYWECNKLGIKIQKEIAINEFNKLPKYDIPQFKTAKDMVWWLHSFLRKAQPHEVEYVFYSILGPRYFYNCGSYLITEDGYKLIENLKDFVAAKPGNYGDHYCENPKIKEQSGNDMDYQAAFYPKYGNSFTRIRVANFKGEFKISDIVVSRYRSQSDIDAVMNATGACKDNPTAFWKTCNLNEVNINVSFPGNPKKETYSDNPNKFALVLNFNNVEWYVSGEKVGSSILDQVKEPIKRPIVAKQLSEETRKKFNATQDRQTVWQCRGTRGHEATWKVNKDGKQVEIKYRSIIFKDVFYQIWAFGNADPKDVNQFFDSIAIER